MKNIIGWMALAVLGTACAQGSTLDFEGSPETEGDAGGGGSAKMGEGAGGPGAGTTVGTTTTSGPGGGGSDGGAGGAAPVSIPPGALVITEVMANPSMVSDTYGEWFEVRNVSRAAVPLDGLVLRHEASDPAAVLTLQSAIVVAPGDHFVFGKSLDPAINGGVPVDYLLPSDLSLTNAGDYLALETPQGMIIDHTFWGAVPLGSSRSLDPAFSSASMNDDDTHYCAATSFLPAGDRGTPNAPNDTCM